MNQKIRPLVEILAEIPDSREAKGKRHALCAILSLCVVAMLAGAKNPKAMAKWWQNRAGLDTLLEQLGFDRGYGPSQSTLYRVLALIDVKEFEVRVSQWVDEIMTDLLPVAEDELEGIAIDGKTLRGSHKQGASGTHLLGALSHRLSLFLTQVGIDDHTNEIGAMEEFLSHLVVEGRVFTMDALLTQRNIAQSIIDEGGDYVMVVKDNQPKLHADLQLLFADPDAEPFFQEQVVMIDKGHGRIERRAIRTSLELNDCLDWPGVQQVFCLDRVTTFSKTGQVRQNTTYGITSLPCDKCQATRLLQLTRGHWLIENRAHWVRDVTFGEDLSQVRNGTLPQMMSALRNCVMNLIRLRRFQFIPDAFDFFAARPFEALTLIGC
jgi:predicted transposase YbfD/YdcC